MARSQNRGGFGAAKIAALVTLVTLGCGASADAAGVDSRTYTCNALHALIAQYRFVFISQATFGDFAVVDGSYCVGGEVTELRSVATSDNPECLINYCVSRDSGMGSQ